MIYELFKKKIDKSRLENHMHSLNLDEDEQEDFVKDLRQRGYQISALN